MLLRHIVSNNCAPLAFDAITYASEMLDRLLAGVKGRRSRGHESAGIMDADLFQRGEGRGRQDLIADAGNNRPIALALVAHLVPSGVVHECRPRRLEIGQRLPLEDVSQLVAGFPDKSRPKADRVDAVFFPDGRKQVPKPGLQLCHLARKSLIYPQFINHRENPLRKTHSLTPVSAGWHRLASCEGACRWPHR